MTAQPDLSFPVQLNIASRLCNAAQEAGWSGRPAFLYRERAISYRDIRGAAARCAALLRQLGIEREKRVLLALPDAPSFPISFLGTLWGGMVAVPVDAYSSVDQYEFYLGDSRAVAAVVAPCQVEPFLEVADRLPRLRHLIVFADPGAPDGTAGDDGWRSIPEGKRPIVHDGDKLLGLVEPTEPADTHPDEPAFWLYTSGSTGMPKAAVHLHHDMWVAAECWGRCTLAADPEAVHLSASKLYFAYGLGNTLHCPMWTGGRAVLVPEKPTPDTVLDAISRYGVTHFYGVPSFYNALLGSEKFEATCESGALGSLRVCISAGEALPASLCRAWTEKTGAPLLDGIGSTELLHIFIANRIDDIKPGCSGKPIVGYEARIVTEDGEDADTDVVGDLWIKGDSACAFYWNRHAASKAAIRGEWFVTGDKYRRDEDGYYWYAGRADDMFKVHGLWVSPPEVESVLLEHPGVHEAAVVCGADEEGLPHALAFVVPIVEGGGGDQLAAELGEHVAKQMSRHCVPGEVRFCSSLPKTPTGKVQRFRLREQV